MVWIWKWKKMWTSTPFKCFFKNHWIWSMKMDFHLPFLGECNVHLPFAYCLALCRLSNLLLNPCCASKIGTHVPIQTCLQAHLKVMVKSITNFLDNSWSPRCTKLCFSVFFNNSNSCFIGYNSQIHHSFGSFILFFSFFDFLYSCLSLKYLSIQ